MRLATGVFKSIETRYRLFLSESILGSSYVMSSIPLKVSSSIPNPRWAWRPPPPWRTCSAPSRRTCWRGRRRAATAPSRRSPRAPAAPPNPTKPGGCARRSCASWTGAISSSTMADGRDRDCSGPFTFRGKQHYNDWTFTMSTTIRSCCQC